MKGGDILSGTRHSPSYYSDSRKQGVFGMSGPEGLFSFQDPGMYPFGVEFPFITFFSDNFPLIPHG